MPLIITTLLIALTSILAQYTALYNVLIWQRSAIYQGEWWRIITGNMVHTNGWHLIMNLAGLFLLVILFQRYLTAKRLLLLLLYFSTVIGSLLLITQLNWYVGLSGMLHGLFFWGIGLDIKNKLKGGWLFLIAGIFKVVWEQIYGGSSYSSELINAQVATQAHFAGMAAAFFLLLFTRLKEKSHNLL
ncbi:rhombosortase [Vibrio sp. SS-MA-C1-2]|uniref:rhombosortase n=1 Tax=Vibrio sp. SS-MA-C1-2 TaxID=2908646 RepID=UPI001F299F6C|nr:rhombosortase [Vibrio sp. SS-MA-C1-2]UJF19760.1 rhombosortase [Vibrio sp. SS-MA-C1-2]